MKLVFDRCACFRESLCLRASEALSQEECASLSSHLAVCVDCQRYQDEIMDVTATLAVRQKSLGSVEPSQDAHARWANDFTQALESDRPAWIVTLFWFLRWSEDMVWPFRWIWAGLTAVWLMI